MKNISWRSQGILRIFVILAAVLFTLSSVLSPADAEDEPVSAQQWTLEFVLPDGSPAGLESMEVNAESEAWIPQGPERENAQFETWMASSAAGSISIPAGTEIRQGELQLATGAVPLSDLNVSGPVVLTGVYLEQEMEEVQTDADSESEEETQTEDLTAESSAEDSAVEDSAEESAQEDAAQNASSAAEKDSQERSEQEAADSASNVDDEPDLSAQAAADVYAILDTSAGTLTFEQGTAPASTATQLVYTDINNHTGAPAWDGQQSSIRTVAFNTSVEPVTLQGWFSGAAGLTAITGLSNLDTSQAESMANLFNGCSALTSLDLSHFNTSSAADMGGMFTGCSMLSSVDLGSDFSFSGNGITDTSKMALLPTPPTTGIYSGVVLAQWMNEDGSQSYTPDQLQSSYTASMAGTWSWARDSQVYAQLDASTGEFIIDDGIPPIPESPIFVWTNILNYNQNTASGAAPWRNITYNNRSVDPRAIMTSIEIKAPIQPLRMYCWFWKATNITSAKGLNNIDTSQCTTMRNVFANCENLTDLDVSSWDVANVTDFYGAFYKIGTPELDLSNFHTRANANYQQVFTASTALKTLNIENFNTTSASNMTNFLGSVSNLSNITLGPNFLFQGSSILPTPTDGSDFNAVKYTGLWCRLGDNDTGYSASDMKTAFNADPASMAGTWVWQEKPAYATLDTTTGEMTFAHGTPPTATSTLLVWTDVEDHTGTPLWDGHQSEIRSVNFEYYIEPVSMQDWFSGAVNLTSITGMENLVTDEVTNMSGTFENCSSLDSLDLSSFNTSSVTDMGNMLSGCTNLDSITLGSNFSFKGDGITDSSKMALLPEPTLSASGNTVMEGKWTNADESQQLTSLEMQDQYDASMAGTWTRKPVSQKYVTIDTTTGEMVFQEGIPPEPTSTLYVYTGFESSTTAPWIAELDSVQSVDFQTTVAPVSTASWFSGASNLTSVSNLSNLDTSNVTNMSSMFNGCSSLTTLNTSGWDTSNVVSMSNLFQGCTALTSLDVSAWTTSNVVSMNNLFAGCRALKTLDVSHWNTSKTENMNGMFSNCTGIDSLDLSNFDTSAATDMGNMFNGCSKLSSVDLGADFSFAGNGITDASKKAILPVPPTTGGYAGIVQAAWKSDAGNVLTAAQLQSQYNSSMAGTWTWNTASGLYATFDSTTGELVVDNGTMPVPSNTVYVWVNIENGGTPWAGVKSSIRTVDFRATYRPITMSGWFQGCTGITSFSGMENLDTSNVTSMRNTFANCSGITSLDVSHFNTEKVTNMLGMFWDCNQLTELDCSSFTSPLCTTFENMFIYCRKLQNLNIGNLNTSSSTNNNNMFYADYQLQEVTLSPNYQFLNATLYNPSQAGTTYNPDLYTNKWCLETQPAVGYTAAQLKSNYDSSMAGTWVWQEKMVYATLDTTTGAMVFNYGEPPAATDTLKVYTGFENSTTVPWANDMSSIQTVDFQTTVAPVSTANWFSGATNLTSVSNASNLDTSNDTDMSAMFNGCAALANLDVSSWDTSNVTNMSNLFNGCAALTSLDVSSWDTSKVTNMYALFASCTGLTSLDVTNWKTPSVTTLQNTFYNCTALQSLDLSGWDISQVTTMQNLCNNCRQLTSVNVSGWDTSNVISMNAMFRYCQALTSIDVSSFTTDRVNTMYEMFYRCNSLKTLDLSSFKTTNGSMTRIVANCGNLESLNISNFNLVNNVNLNAMFNGDTKLKEIQIGPNFAFRNTSDVSNPFPSPNTSSGIYTGNWVNIDNPKVGYTPAQLMTSYTPDMAGTWVWQLRDINMPEAGGSSSLNLMLGVGAAGLAVLLFSLLWIGARSLKR